jgi:hypothetical protein
MNITDYLSPGKANAKSQKYLAGVTGLSPREVRRAIFNARKAGALICSTCDADGGYFLADPDNPTDAAQYVRMQKSRIKSAQTAIKAVADFVKQANSDTNNDNISLFDLI